MQELLLNRQKLLSPQTKQIYADEIQKRYSSEDNPLYQDTGKSRLLLASSEADKTSREELYKDAFNLTPHAHGAFTFHLLRGLEGDAANGLGLITFESLQKYLEDKMVNDEKKQRPLHTFDNESSRLDKIRIGKSMKEFLARVKEFLSEARESSSTPDLKSLRYAVQNIKEIQELDKVIPRFLR